MNNKFKLSKTLYIILFYVFIFGVVLEFTRSEYVLRFHSDIKEQSKVNYIPLSEKLKSSLKEETYLVVNNPDSPENDSMVINNNVIETLGYMHKKSIETPVRELKNDLHKYSGVIITFEEINLIPNLTQLETYVEEGGSVFFAMRPGLNDALYQLYRKLGMYDIGDFTQAHGIELTSNILINQRGMRIDDDFLSNSSLAIGLESSSRLHAKSINNIPLLWDVSYGKGRFVVFNGTILGTKDSRGLIAGSISMMKDDFIYPILNMKIANIDDFPAPIPEGYNSFILKEHEMNTESFYRNVWWPFIQDGAEKYDVKYAGFVIQTYNNRIQAPFADESGQQQENLIKYGRDLLKMGGEIGIHGYNHQSLTTDQEKVRDLGYKAWKSQDDMEAALKESAQYLKEAFPNLEIKSYVPPSNIIDESGLAAIQAAFPSINVMSALYLEDAVDRSYIQEFEDDGRFRNLPRITSGYGYTNNTKWAIANAMTSIGVFSHFIHPDDILDEERASSKSWGQLSQEYNLMLQTVKEDYPWLRSTLPSDAADGLERYTHLSIYTEEINQGLRVYCDNFSGEVSFIYRTNKKITTVKDCKVEKVDEGVYFVKGQKEIFEIGLGE
jgi:hypothetical protein